MRPRALRKTESFTLPVETERFREYCRSPSFLALLKIAIAYDPKYKNIV